MFKSRSRPAAALVVLSLLVTMGVVTGTASPAAAQASQWRAVSAGGQHTCGIKLNRTLWCWGDNQAGQLGVGDTVTRVVPTQVGSASGWTAVTAGGFHTCGIHNGERYCWGHNGYGQLGLTGGNRLTPIRRLNEGTWHHLAAGTDHTCGLHGTSPATQLRCWGRNTFGQLGLGDTTHRNLPTTLGSSTGWQSLTLGRFHTCGVQIHIQDPTQTPRRLCWGTNAIGQSGLGANINSSLFPRRGPETLAWSTGLSNISAGGWHTCGRASDGRLYCWGDNSGGQLGLNDTTERYVPAASLTGAVFVAGGEFHTCVIMSSNGQVRRACVGSNASGQLGLGNTTSRTNWQLANDGISWSGNLTAGNYHTCGISSDQSLYCWGFNNSGRLGVGDWTNRLVPTQVLG